MVLELIESNVLEVKQKMTNKFELVIQISCYISANQQKFDTDQTLFSFCLRLEATHPVLFHHRGK